MARKKVVYALGTWAVVVSSSTFVRSGAAVPEGNSALIDRGAFPIDEHTQDGDARLAGPLEEITELAQTVFQADRALSDAQPGTVEFTEIDQADLIHAVWPRIEAELATEKTAKELCTSLNVRQRQISDWLKAAEDEGLVERRTRPVRYILKRKPLNSGQMAFLPE
jgi:predicted Rossmann fold nucleotide-binding protein DprA/Smf involved in DNA uptake